MNPNNINKFAVLTTQRSGSNFFCFWLNNHPNIRCHSELFLKKYVGMDGFSYYSGSKNYRKILGLIFCNAIMKNIPVNYIISVIIKNFFYSLLYNPAHSGPITDNENLELRNQFHRQNNPENDKSVGFKLMYDQLNEYKTLKNLLIKECCKIIHLIRNNVLKMYLSKLARRKRGIAHSASEVDEVKVHVDPLSLLKYIEKTEEMKNQMRKLFSSNDYLEITYEEFMENYEIFSEKIFDFLEVDNIDVRIPVLKKLNPNSSKDIILNYDEISELLKDTLYARFLD